MKPKIGIILTPNGIETVVVMNQDRKSRLEAYRLLPIVNSEINKFEAAFLNKIRKELKHAEPE